MCGYTYTYIYIIGGDAGNVMKRIKNKTNYDIRGN